MLKDHVLAVGVAAAVGFGSALAASPVVLNQAVEVVGAGAVADPLIALEADRAAIVNRLATEFGEAAARAGVNQETLRGVLSSLRADQLLAASLVGTFAELTAIVVHTPSDRATLQRYVALTPMVPQTLSALPFAQAYLTRQGDTLTVTRVQDLRLGEASVVGYFLGASGVTLGVRPITPKDGATVAMTPNASINFGATYRQMINVYGTDHGMGMQSGTVYFRTNPGGTGGFAWYRGGTHNDNAFNNGGGTTLMSIDFNGNLTTNGTVNGVSDVARKTDFAAIDPSAVLARVAAMPITTWRYRDDAASVRHIGPTAQDFAAAFAVGADDKHIAMVDADGVALAAIKGLNAKVEAQAREIAELRRAIEVLMARTQPDAKMAAAH